MYKTKFFYHYGSQEPEMNEWFKENPNIEIISITQSSGMSKYDTLNTLITLVYKKASKYQDMGPG